MTPDRVRRRRELARAISRVADATVEQSLALDLPAASSGSQDPWRIGVTGAPGVGKSSLIGALAQRRLERLGARSALTDDAPDERLAVLAIDPSSPLTQGSVLGDRIRMDALTADPRVFMRSLPSRGGRDGLAGNIVDLMALIAAHGVDEIILETVGIGQAEHAVRLMVDTLVLVLHPESGDSVQAMKAGVMELADVYVVNKADLPGARRTLAELRATLSRGKAQDGCWHPPILAVAQSEAASIDALDDAIEAHRLHCLAQGNRASLAALRRAYHVDMLITRRLEELRAARAILPDRGGEPVAVSYTHALRALSDSLPGGV